MLVTRDMRGYGEGLLYCASKSGKLLRERGIGSTLTTRARRFRTHNGIVWASHPQKTTSDATGKSKPGQGIEVRLGPFCCALVVGHRDWTSGHANHAPRFSATRSATCLGEARPCRPQLPVGAALACVFCTDARAKPGALSPSDRSVSWGAHCK